MTQTNAENNFFTKSKKGGKILIIDLSNDNHLDDETSTRLSTSSAHEGDRTVSNLEENRRKSSCSEKDLEFTRFFPKPKFDCKKMYSIILQSVLADKNMGIAPLHPQQIIDKLTDGACFDLSNDDDSTENNSESIKKHQTRSKLYKNWDNLIRISPETRLNEEKLITSGIIDDYFDLVFKKNECLTDDHPQTDAVFSTSISDYITDQFIGKLYKTKGNTIPIKVDNQEIFLAIKNMDRFFDVGIKLNARRIFIPINVDFNSHWILAVVDFEEKTLMIFDSLQSKNTQKSLNRAAQIKKMLIFLRSIYHIVTSKELIESKQRREEFRKAKQDFNSKVFKKVYGKDLMCNISEADGERFIKASFVEKVEDECLRSLMVENLMEDFFDQVKNDINSLNVITMNDKMQKNGIDCGVFVMAAVKIMHDGGNLSDLSQSRIPAIRDSIFSSLFIGSIAN